MTKERQPLYDLTPLGPDWPIGARVAEIGLQTVGLIVFRPLIVVLNIIFFGFPKRAR
jgi:hypothetical protein